MRATSHAQRDHPQPRSARDRGLTGSTPDSPRQWSIGDPCMGGKPITVNPFADSGDGLTLIAVDYTGWRLVTARTATVTRTAARATNRVLSTACSNQKWDVGW